MMAAIYPAIIWSQVMQAESAYEDQQAERGTQDERTATEIPGTAVMSSPAAATEEAPPAAGPGSSGGGGEPAGGGAGAARWMARGWRSGGGCGSGRRPGGTGGTGPRRPTHFLPTPDPGSAG
jgi:hypothetical protein